jgi:hypothetical protein
VDSARFESHALSIRNVSRYVLAESVVVRYWRTIDLAR